MSGRKKVRMLDRTRVGGRNSLAADRRRPSARFHKSRQMATALSILTSRGAPPPLDNAFASQRSAYQERNVTAEHISPAYVIGAFTETERRLCALDPRSGASQATDGKPPAEGRVQARSRTSPALCPFPAAAVSRAVDQGRKRRCLPVSMNAHHHGARHVPGTVVFGITDWLLAAPRTAS